MRFVFVGGSSRHGALVERCMICVVSLSSWKGAKLGRSNAGCQHHSLIENVEGVVWAVAALTCAVVACVVGVYASLCC
jgi:hypothetical protein